MSPSAGDALLRLVIIIATALDSILWHILVAAFVFVAFVSHNYNNAAAKFPFPTSRFGFSRLLLCEIIILLVAFVASLNGQTKRVGKTKKHLRISTQKIIFHLHNSGGEQQKVSRPKKMENSLELNL